MEFFNLVTEDARDFSSTKVCKVIDDKFPVNLRKAHKE